MGAYYMATIAKNGEVKMYSTHDVDNGLKLMEHSYIENEYVERIMSMLQETPGHLTWLCDYYEGPGLTWGNVEEATKEEFLEDSDYIDSDYFVLNLTQNLCIDIDEAYKLSRKASTSWPIHPLPILCNSNEQSQGGGDFHQEDSRRATWKGDLIQIVLTADDVPEGFTDVTEDVIFIEER